MTPLFVGGWFRNSSSASARQTETLLCVYLLLRKTGCYLMQSSDSSGKGFNGAEGSD